MGLDGTPAQEEAWNNLRNRLDGSLPNRDSLFRYDQTGPESHVFLAGFRSGYISYKIESDVQIDVGLFPVF
jgi:hypothetical protein